MVGKILDASASDAVRHAQIAIITHSPYLVPNSHIERVYRFTKKADDITGLSHLASAPQKNSSNVATMRREDRWARSTNWPTVLFSSFVLIVDGDTEVGALTVWYDKAFGESMELVNVSILSTGGKPRFHAAVRDLNAFGIAWVALVDGDSLKSDQSGLTRPSDLLNDLQAACGITTPTGCGSGGGNANGPALRFYRLAPKLSKLLDCVGVGVPVGVALSVRENGARPD